MDIFIVKLHHYSDCDAYEHFRDNPDTLKLFFDEEKAKKYCDDYVSDLRQRLKEEELKENPWWLEGKEDKDCDVEYIIDTHREIQCVENKIDLDGGIDVTPTSYKDGDKYTYAWVEDGVSIDIYKIKLP